MYSGKSSRLPLQGYLYAIGSGILFGINPTFRLISTDHGMGVSAVIFLSMASAMVLAFFMQLVRNDHETFHLPGRVLLKLILAGAVGTGLTGYLLLLSYSYISSGCAVIIHFTYPTLTCIAGALFFRNPFNWKKIAAVILSIAGVFFISGGFSAVSIKGILIAFASAVTFGGYSLFLGQDKDLSRLSSFRQLPYLLTGASLVSLLLCVVQKDWGTFNCLTVSGSLLSGICVLFATLLFTLGVQRIGAAPTGFCSLFEPITCVLTGILLRAEPITGMILLGILLSLTAVVVTVLDGMEQT